MDALKTVQQPQVSTQKTMSGAQAVVQSLIK
jgi:hypothetical protein